MTRRSPMLQWGRRRTSTESDDAARAEGVVLGASMGPSTNVDGEQGVVFGRHSEGLQSSMRAVVPSPRAGLMERWDLVRSALRS